MNEKNTIMTPFTITDKLCGPYSFARTSKETLNDKMELYFQDFSFIPLFIQVGFSPVTDLTRTGALPQDEPGAVRQP